MVTEKGSHAYDWLVLALGSRTLPEVIDGLVERWGRQAHGFYTPDSALRLAGALDRFQGGDLVIDIAEMPIKCPVAPLEFACLVDDYLTRRGMRSKTELTLVTPLTGAFTKPICNEVLTDMLVEKGVKVIPNASLAAVTDKTIVCPDGKAVPYDLLVTIPPHEGSDLIDDAGLGDGIGFGLTDSRRSSRSRPSASSWSATTPMSRPRRPARSRISRPRWWCTTCCARSTARRRCRWPTAMPTASSKPVMARRY